MEKNISENLENIKIPILENKTHKIWLLKTLIKTKTSNRFSLFFFQKTAIAMLLPILAISFLTLNTIFFPSNHAQAKDILNQTIAQIEQEIERKPTLSEHFQPILDILQQILETQDHEYIESPTPTPGTIKDAISLIAKNRHTAYIEGDLTIDPKDSSFITDEDGVKMFVINGDLIIKDNIRIGTCKEPTCTLHDISSLIFIVMEGNNIYIEPKVTELAGIYILHEKVNKAGQFISGNKTLPNITSENALTITGSVFGNIGPLLKAREKATDLKPDQSPITIQWKNQNSI